jgi:hypothetical protein
MAGGTTSQWSGRGGVPSRRARWRRWWSTRERDGGTDLYALGVLARLWSDNERQRVLALIALSAAHHRAEEENGLDHLLVAIDEADAATVEGIDAARDREARLLALIELVAVLTAEDDDLSPVDAEDVVPLVDQLVEDLILAPSAPPRLRVVLAAA